MRVMAADNVYGSVRMATSYAFSRPPVHPQIISKIRQDLGIGQPVPRALDIGSGAGLSAAALAPIARFVVGLEPVPAMLIHRRAVAPNASFVAAVAERMPFAAGTFDVVTAAGSLNYVNLPVFFRDLTRVLTDKGVMIIYDFSAGRRLRSDSRLEGWYGAFEQRYPPKPGYDMDVRTLDYAGAGLALEAFEAFEVAVPMTLQSYVTYVMSETGVELAIAGGVPEDHITTWCESTLRGVFGDESRDVLFDAYAAYVSRGPSY
jgi:SAM-dependent methyltransferase